MDTSEYCNCCGQKSAEFRRMLAKFKRLTKSIAIEKISDSDLLKLEHLFKDLKRTPAFDKLTKQKFEELLHALLVKYPEEYTICMSAGFYKGKRYTLFGMKILFIHILDKEIRTIKTGEK